MKQYEAQRTAVTAELADITTALTELGVRNPRNPEDWVTTPIDTNESEADENIVADRSEEWQERRGELSALETRYHNLRRALNKLDTGTYGTCEVCGQPIAQARLEANPAARTCHNHFTDEANLPN